MKKLMTMIAAAATAFGLYAAAVDDSGTSFELGLEGTSGALSAKIPLPDELGIGGWDVVDETTVVSYEAEGVAKYQYRWEDKFGPSNNWFLKLKTGSNELARYAKGKGESYDVAADGNYFFDSVVQLTAFDTDPSDDITGAKVALWLLEDEDAGTTNLMIKVGSGKAIVTDGDYSALLGNWARVTIKALPIAEGKIGFVLFIDTTAVVVDPNKVVDTTLNAIAQAYQKDGLLIVSGTDTEIASVGFKGTGLVDDIAFTQTVPGDWAEDPAVYTIAWDSSKMTDVKTNGFAVVGDSPVTVYGTAPASMNISWTGFGKYASGSETVEVGEDGNFDFSEVEVDEADATFGGKQWTLEKAVELADAATEDGELALLKDVDAISIANENAAVITINLGGFALTGSDDNSTIDAQSAVVVSNGTVTAGTKQSAIYGDDVTIYGGTFNGEISGEGIEIFDGVFNGTVAAAETTVIHGGHFLASANEGLAEAATFDEYKTLIVDPADENYLIVGDAANYVAQIGDNKYETIAAAVADAKDGDTIKIIAAADVSEQLKITSKGTITFENNATVTFADLYEKGDYSVVIDDTTVNFTGTGTWIRPETKKNTKTGAGGGSVFRCGATTKAIINITSGTFIAGTNLTGEVEGVTTSGASAIFQAKNAEITVNGGDFTNERIDEARCVRADAATSVVTINGGTFWTNPEFKGGSTATTRVVPVDNKGAGTVSITGGQFKCHPDNVTEIMNPFCGEGYKLKDDGTGWFVRTAIQYWTVTITPVDNCTIAVTNGETEVTTGAKFDQDLTTVLKVTRTPAEGYELDGCAAYEEITLTGDATITATVKKAEDPYPPFIPDDPEVKGKYDQWKLIPCPDGDTQLTEQADLQDAFLLNCAPGEAALETAKANFKVTSITQDAEGNWIVKVAGEKGQNETYGNGYVNIISVKEAKFPTAGDAADFFQATLTFKPVLKQ